MNDRWKSVGRWLLVPVVFMTSSLTVYVFGLGLFIYLEFFEIHWAAAVHLNLPPSHLLKIIDSLEIFLLAMIWAVPVAWAVGFAMRVKSTLSLLWGVSISLLLTAVFVWFAGEPYSRIFAVIASMALIGGAVYFIARKAPVRTLMFVNLAALVLLFIPRLTVPASVPKQPPLAHKVWSVVLQKGTWQGMNTGSEFGATRQLTFAGDRIISVFDAGYPFYEGKEPMSNYRVLSLDRNTGAIKNQMEFVGKWGAMPYAYGTHDGKVALVYDGSINLLNPDLSPTGIGLPITRGTIETISSDGKTIDWDTLPGTTVLDADNLQPIAKLWGTSSGPISRNGSLSIQTSFDSAKKEELSTLEDANGGLTVLFHGKCGFPAGFLSDNRILITGCGEIYLLDAQGKMIHEESSGDTGKFAGVSQNGSRFALQYSDERGDPSVLLYEQFVIYDATTLKPLASVSVDDLPDRESWSAFSPDGHFFAVGNPDKLTLYQIR